MFTNRVLPSNCGAGNGIGEENSSLVRRHTRRAKEVAEGIEDIIEEMPSRTVGEKIFLLV